MRGRPVHSGRYFHSPPRTPGPGLVGLFRAAHSLLASLGLKRRVARERPEWMRAYRLVYNGLALLLLAPPLALT